MLLGVTHVLQDGNQIGDRGAEMIGEGLKVNSSLQRLHLVSFFRSWVLLVDMHEWCFLLHVLSQQLSQSNQSSGPFNFSGSSLLMRVCRNLTQLNFQCLDWSACVASESWGELPVPPAEVIARGTRAVFEFVKAALRGDLVEFRSCRVMVVGPQMVR